MLAEENRIDELYDAVLVIGAFEHINAYVFKLKQRYGKELLAIYQEYVDGYAQSARHTDKYKQIVSYLKQMRAFPEGESVVEELKTKWRIEYPTRKEMHSLLRDV